MNGNQTPEKVARNLLFSPIAVLISALSITAIGFLVNARQDSYGQSICDFGVVRLSERIFNRCDIYIEFGLSSQIVFVGSLVCFLISPIIYLTWFIVLYKKEGIIGLGIDLEKINFTHSIGAVIFFVFVLYSLFLMDIDIEELQKYSIILSFPGSVLFNSLASFVCSFAFSSPLLLVLKNVSGGGKAK